MGFGAFFYAFWGRWVQARHEFLLVDPWCLAGSALRMGRCLLEGQFQLFPYAFLLLMRVGY